MEVTDELIIVALAFFCGIASAWMCLENRMSEISAENDFILRRKESLEICWADAAAFIHGLREVNGENGTVVGGYFDRADMDALKEKIKEIEILMADEWRLK